MNILRTFLNKSFPRKERRPTPSYVMYVNTASIEEGRGTGFSCIRYGRFRSLEQARETALHCLERGKDDRYKHIQSFDLYDDFSVTNTGYAKDNWELTPNTRIWTYYEDERATGPFLYDSEGNWLGWQREND